jgi:hypothetical protein
VCVALHDASFGQTTVAGWRFPRRQTHCVMYGNEPRNRVTVPNAMLLHIPVAHGTTLTRDNFLPTSGLSLVLEDMWLAAPKFEERLTRSIQFGVAKGGSVAVFDMGKYTWVAATRADPAQVSAALETVRPDRRPQVGEPLIEFYLRTWPDDALAIACFNQASGEATEPAAIEYVPQNWDVLRMPAVDAHGEIPGFDRPVTVNHRLIIGTDEFGAGGRVTYREQGRMDPRLREVLPGRVVGAELLQVPMANGDFYVDFGRFTRGHDGSETSNGHVLRAHGPALTGQADRIPLQLG